MASASGQYGYGLRARYSNCQRTVALVSGRLSMPEYSVRVQRLYLSTARKGCIVMLLIVEGEIVVTLLLATEARPEQAGVHSVQAISVLQ